MFQQLLAILATFAISAAIDPIEVRGNAFFVQGTNNRFYIRGVDYQPGGSSNLTDPLANEDTCTRDIEYFQDLGLNTIRVYSIDNTKDHDACMEKLADAGIYLILDVNIPDASISRADAACSYNSMYLEQVFATVEKMAKYDNTLGYFAGNEVINDEVTDAAMYVKAVVRDMKMYIRERNLRLIPVGYSAADVEQNRLQTAHYFNCGDDEMARIDMFGFNDYSWCGDSSYRLSGYDQKVASFDNYSVPLFFSEYGCNQVTPRSFTEVEAIYSEEMTPVFSGGLVYEYSQEESDYGLVELDGDDVSTLTDYDNLKSEFERTDNPSGDGGYKSDLDFSECPALSSNWNVTGDLPSTPDTALAYINGTLDPVGLGYDATTQWACVMEEAVSGGSSSRLSSSTSTSGAGSNSGSGSSSDSNSSSSSSSEATQLAPISKFKVLVTITISTAILAGYVIL